MPPNRGTDFSTDQRQLRSREENDGIGRFLQTGFDGMVEVLVFSLPVLTLVFLTSDVEITFVTIAAIVALAVGVTVQRFRPLGRPWPKMTLRLIVARLVVYNVTLVAGLALGRWLFSSPMIDFTWLEQPILGPSVVAAVVGLVVVAGFPALAARIERTRHR